MPKRRRSSRSTPDATELAFRAFVRVSGLFQSTMEPYFAGFGISGAQWGVLRSLHRARAAGLPGLRPTDLGKWLLVRPPSVTGVVSRLERMGLVARRAVASDRRAKQVVLTPRGGRMLARVLREHPAQMRAVLGGLSGPETKQLHRLMERMAAHLECIGAPRRRTRSPRR
jgi:DNA-binding MarR family transcriptional regulator